MYCQNDKTDSKIIPTDSISKVLSTLIFATLVAIQYPKNINSNSFISPYHPEAGLFDKTIPTTNDRKNNKMGILKLKGVFFLEKMQVKRKNKIKISVRYTVGER